MQVKNITELQSTKSCYDTSHTIDGNTYAYKTTCMLGSSCLFLYEHEPSYNQNKDTRTLILGLKNVNDTITPTVPKLMDVSKVESPVSEGISEDNIIGDVVNVKFTTLPGTPSLKGKVDTGADISSLHADKYSIQGNQVHIQCSKISPNILTLPLRDQQAVKSVSGVQYRPVVEMTIRINDKLISNVLFNIADRTSMDYPVLVGKNILEKGKFLINPSMAEGTVVWNEIADSLELVENLEHDNSDNIRAVYETLKNNNVNFTDLLDYVKGEVTKTFEDIKY